MKSDIDKNDPIMSCILYAMFLKLRIVLVSWDTNTKSHVFTPTGRVSRCYIDLDIIARTSLAKDKSIVFLQQSKEKTHYDLVLFNGQVGEFINNGVVHR